MRFLFAVERFLFYYYVFGIGHLYVFIRIQSSQRIPQNRLLGGIIGPFVKANPIFEVDKRKQFKVKAKVNIVHVYVIAIKTQTNACVSRAGITAEEN